jgi:hypothetical protein
MGLRKMFGFDTSGKSKEVLYKEYKEEKKAYDKAYKESRKKDGYWKGTIWTPYED